MVEPRSCVELGCRFLYSYVDALTGTQYVGCMQEVFAAKVELDAVLQPGGFGGVKMTGTALPPTPAPGPSTAASTSASSTAPTTARRACGHSICAILRQSPPVSKSTRFHVGFAA
jgi:hypothetical protein